jgi:hypothetical protein
MIVLAVAATVLLAGILVGYVLLQEHTIQMLEETIRVQAQTEHRMARTVHVLREELVHLSASSQVVTLWRDKQQVPS